MSPDRILPGSAGPQPPERDGASRPFPPPFAPPTEEPPEAAGALGPGPPRSGSRSRRPSHR